MPFLPQTPRPLTPESVGTLRPGQRGCYGLLRQNGSGIEWIYVGKGLLRKHLLAMIEKSPACITSRGATHFVAEAMENPAPRAHQLIQELKPLCNRSVQRPATA
jgi:hypothetical protein